MMIQFKVILRRADTSIVAESIEDATGQTLEELSRSAFITAALKVPEDQHREIAYGELYLVQVTEQGLAAFRMGVRASDAFDKFLAEQDGRKWYFREEVISGIRLYQIVEKGERELSYALAQVPQDAPETVHERVRTVLSGKIVVGTQT